MSFIKKQSQAAKICRAARAGLRVLSQIRVGEGHDHDIPDPVGQSYDVKMSTVRCQYEVKKMSFLEASASKKTFAGA